MEHSQGVGQVRHETAAAAFLARCLLLDLETDAKGERLLKIGALRGSRTFERQGRFDTATALEELEGFSAGAQFCLGHNLLDHDLPLLRGLTASSPLLALPVIDTLYLSPLAFPANPYHRLVKDYKLVKQSVNNPLADATLAGSLFLDQWLAFAAMPPELPAFFRYGFAAAFTGIDQGFAAMGAALPSPIEALKTLVRLTDGKVCRTHFRKVAFAQVPSRDGRVALAYVLAWLGVAGSHSVLPPWVRRRWPLVGEILRELRDHPCEDPKCGWCRATHGPLAQLERWFGFDAFRAQPTTPEGGSLQQAIVAAGMRDEPLLAILPTGGGKSLCYQLPALARHQRLGVLTLVISPLQALMKDQVDNLIAKTGVTSAAALNGLLTPPERTDVLERVRLGDVAILYVSPEQLRNTSFRQAIAMREIGAWVFDEAHCLSKWGHDFRPDYLYAGRFIREFAAEQGWPIPPVACFTATAKPAVRDEILEFFQRTLTQDLRRFEGGTERENLSFEVQAAREAEKWPRLQALLMERLGGSGAAVVYLATRQRVQKAAEYLGGQGWPAAAFHAGLSAPEKRRIQEEFIAGSIRVICATNAFGMGIDKEDVRLVLHADIPGSLENYLQEAGRAGRDFQQAECVLLYDEKDIETQFRLGASSQLNRKDIAELLRGIRRAKRNRAGDIVLTAAELLRDEELDTGFDTDDRQYDTKVKTAVAWLERGGFLERNENHSRVFQGQPLVRDLEEARRRMRALQLSEQTQAQWLALLETLINANPDLGIGADELAGLAPFKAFGQEAGKQVLRGLHAMAEAGLLDEGLLLTALLRYKVKDPSRARFEALCALERALLERLRLECPEADEGEWQELSLRRLNQRLLDDAAVSDPTALRRLLKGLAQDGRGLAGEKGSIEWRPLSRDHYRVRLRRSWTALVETAERRRQVAKVVLETLLAKVPPEAPPSAELLVAFGIKELTEALGQDRLVQTLLKDPLAAVDRALLFLHLNQVIELQQGLGVFHQAMTIRLSDQSKGRRYSQGDFEPLAQHYQERVFQVHVMQEYARLGLERIGRALGFVLDYFTLDRRRFIERWFADRGEELKRATGQESYHRIVETLNNPGQQAIVGAPVEENLLILAGPGSGKTRVVVHRCAWLLRVARVPARAILVVCFNRNAALELRRRLSDLVGADARGVQVQTYHGLAMRLSGRSFAADAEGGGAFRLDEVIPEAIRLLRGEIPLMGLEADAVRDQILGGYRHILVDEYQDIDQAQYDLVSAIAGRTQTDADERLALLAVGDDDQNIYGFRGANVEFIRRFAADYQARTYHLLENYRSSGHIIAAANQFIAHNRDRMKGQHPIRLDGTREDEPPGEVWSQWDPLAQGRVQILTLSGLGRQAVALVEELRRLTAIAAARGSTGPDYAGCAILARTRQILYPIRAWLEHLGLPLTWGLERDKTPPLHRIREIADFLEQLKERRHQSAGASELLAGLGSESDNPWSRFLRPILEDWAVETTDAETPIDQAIEFLYETLAEQRRESRLGEGVFLSTVHAAKGLEFDHVFLPDGGWRDDKEQIEEERRAYYVGLTRARQTLTMIDAGLGHPHVALIEGDHCLRRTPALDLDIPAGILNRRYDLLGPADLFLDHAGLKPPDHPIHAHLAALQPGDRLALRVSGGHLVLLDAEGFPVARLAKQAAQTWRPRLARVEGLRLVALVRRLKTDSTETFRDRVLSERWEVPLGELVWQER